VRNTTTSFTLALLLACPALAGAQEQPAPARTLGTFDVGFRASDIDGDAARFQRFQDIREQGAGINFSLDRESPAWWLRARARNVGYRDQRYHVDASNSRLSLAFAWNQTPLFYGNTTATAYVQSAPGVFTLDPAARLAVQNGAAIGIPRTPAQAVSPSIYRALASPFDLKSRRDTAAFRLAFAATRELTLNLDVSSYTRTGAQPWGAAFGFSALTELPLTLDNRTTDLTAGAEWANRKGMVRIAYEGSFFTNHVETLTWDNPLRATDYNQNPWTATGYDPSGYVTGNGAAQGRMALAPSNHANGVNGLGMIKLPRRSSLSAAFGVVNMNQDAALIPWTINPVIADPRVYEQFPGLASLDRASAEADVRLVNANVSFNSRPNRRFGLTARYRHLNRDDRTPLFDATEYVRFDAVPIRGGSSTRHLDLTRHTINVDATVTPLRYTALRVGVGRDSLDHARAYARLADTTLRASVHVTGHQYLGLRALYEHTIREGSRVDETALTRGSAQPASRWYDDASRTRDRTTMIVDLTPAQMVGLNASVYVGRDTYDGADQQFGLLNNDNTGYTVGLSIAPGRGVSFGATFGHERYASLQRSRAATGVTDPSWSDPDRNWDLDSDETVRTVAINLDLLRTLRNTEIRLGYDWTDSDQGFVYGGPRIDELVAMGQFVALPEVTNAWRRATLDVRYFMTPKVGVGAGYWYNKFDIEDYQMLDLPDGTPRTDYVGSLMLGYGYRPFNANTGFVRVFYLF
jgi:MtrB/PioB family decaheme-associated outer membrane protein